MKLKQILLCYGLFVTALSVSAATNVVKIISFNDFHGNLESPGGFGVQLSGAGTPIIQSSSVGGVDMLAAYISKLKVENPNNILVSSGDLIGASPLVSGLFHDEPTIEIMNQLGLAFNAVGNHEFDEGLAELKRMQYGGCHPFDANSCKSKNLKFSGAKFKFLAANVVNIETNKTIFPAYGIKIFKQGQHKIRIAFIGLTLQATPQIVNHQGIKGLRFTEEASTINQLIPSLKAQGANAIVVLIHQGGSTEHESNLFINDCPFESVNPELSPIKKIVSQLDDKVDLVISGHTHTGYICKLPNKMGRKILVTQANAYGRVLTDINLSFDLKKAKLTSIDAKNFTVDRLISLQPNQKIKKIIDHYAKFTDILAKIEIGNVSEPIANICDLSGENPVGDLIADAQLFATSGSSLKEAQIAFQNPGGIRGPGFLFAQGQPHPVTYADAFSLQPFGNHLVTMSLSALQIKSLLEQQFVGRGCLLPDGRTKNLQTMQRILQVSKGFYVEWRNSAPDCTKIQNVTLSTYDETNNVTAVDHLISNGTINNPNKLYRITVNNFLANGGDNFSVLEKGIDTQRHIPDIEALKDYMVQFIAPNAPYNPTDPKLFKPRIVKLD